MMGAYATADQGDTARKLVKRHGPPDGVVLHLGYAGTTLERYGVLELQWAERRVLLHPSGAQVASLAVNVAGVPRAAPADPLQATENPYTQDEHNCLINALVAFDRELPDYKDALLHKLFQQREIQARRECALAATCDGNGESRGYHR
jgi:hypothetical protein